MELGWDTYVTRNPFQVSEIEIFGKLIASYIFLQPVFLPKIFLSFCCIFSSTITLWIYSH